MAFNVVCSIIVVFMGGAVQIYTFSNVGYLFSFIPVLIGYYLLRKYRPNVRRPFKLPEWMKYAALGAGRRLRGHLRLGRPGVRRLHLQRGREERRSRTTSSGSRVLLAYLPLYWYRKRVEDKRDARRSARARAARP